MAGGRFRILTGRNRTLLRLHQAPKVNICDLLHALFGICICQITQTGNGKMLLRKTQQLGPIAAPSAAVPYGV